MSIWIHPITIETERLTLRPPSMTDDCNVFQYGSKAETVKYLQWAPLESLHGARAFLARSIDQWRKQESTRSWMLESRAGQEVIGALRATATEGGIEIGFIVNSLLHRKGYGSEALTAVVGHAQSDGVQQIAAVCDAGNVVSQKFLEANNFKAVHALRKHLVHPALGLEPRDCIRYLYVKP